MKRGISITLLVVSQRYFLARTSNGKAGLRHRPSRFLDHLAFTGLLTGLGVLVAKIVRAVPTGG